MCGINLILGGTNRDLEKITAMNEAISHRGLPGRSTITSYFDDRIWLGHIRLPIQGLSEDYDQPMSFRNLDGAFVGEIFNFRSFEPEAATDLPIILKQFHKLGPRAFREFDGFWALVIIDKDSKKVHIFTDFLAKKPLYIRKHPDGSWGISSEIGPLWELGEVTPDELYFSSVLKFGYCTNDQTPFREIRKIPACSHLVYDPRNRAMTINSYDEIVPTFHDLREVLTTAVKNRVISDVPISLLLSGGLDSTIIFQLLKQETENFTIFHVENNEARFLKFLDIPAGVKVIPLSTDEVDVKEALLFNETPVDLGSMLPQFALAKAIKEYGFHVAISGDGADELFGGYRRALSYDSQWSDIFQELVYYHLPRLDKLMMSQTIELRCPYLSRPVIEMALTLPYIKRKQKEYLKETFADIVPPEILKRPKIPLKSVQHRRDKSGYRKEIVRLFREIMSGGPNRV